MISIVIPTYNHCNDLLKPCLESIIKFTDLSQIEVLVVANGCKDNTREYVESLGNPFKLIWIEEPAGYTKATNVGIEQSKGEYIVLLNNDTVLLDQTRHKWIEMLMEPFLTQSNVAITGPSKNLDENSWREFIIFFCAMIKRSVYEKVGVLDEIFSPGFGEDTDWCARAEDEGYKVVQVPTVDPLKKGTGKLMIGDFPIFHEGEATFGNDDTKFQWLIKRNSEILQQRYRNQLPHGAFSENQDVPVYRSFVSRGPDGGRMAEVGTWKGKSLCSVADIIIKKNLSVVAVDTFEGTVSEGNQACGEPAVLIQNIFEHNLKKFKIADRTQVIKGDSAESASLFPDNHFNMVFIDADHSYESVQKDIEAWWPKVKPGGILCGHDWLWHWSVARALKEKFGEESIHTDLCNMWYVDKPMVYDCFMFANELDVLDIRMHELKDVVDKFVIAEAPITQSGLTKPLYLRENWDRFKEFHDKIIHLVIDDMPTGDVDPWERERFQRDSVMRGLINLKDEDIVMISDADEIPRAECVKNYRKEQGIMSFQQQMSYYYVDYSSKEKWEWSKILPYKLFKQMTPCQVRYTHGTQKIENGGWHLSFLGGVDKIIEKIKGYAHQEYNTPAILDRSRIEGLIKEGKDVFGRDGVQYFLIEIDESYPKYLRDNLEKFKHLVFKKDEVKVASDELEEVQLKTPRPKRRETVTAVVSTKNRYHTTLPLVIMSVINQSVLVDKLVIYDDGDRKDLREDPLWRNIFGTMTAKSIDWHVEFGEGKGQVKNHQKSIENCDTDWIWRLDDDNYAEYDTLENLLAAADEKTGAVAGLVLDPKMYGKSEMASNKIEDIYLGLNEQWFIPSRSGWSDKPGANAWEVDHLYSTFIYRKDAAKHGYCKDLSVIGHREETIFTYEMKLAGWKIKINPEAITWHYKNSEGGIRAFKDPNLWAWDDSVLEYKLKQWGVKTRKPKLVVLDSGLGDHYSFLNVLPEMLKKYDDIILAVCYPDVFKDYKGLNIVSIEAAKAMGPIDEYNIYKKMWDWDHKTSMVDAYRRLYL